jgi:hypothetical protein
MDLNENNKKAIKISLIFSDKEFGTSEYGFIPRVSEEDPDDEDFRYQKYLLSQNIKALVAGGSVFLRK